MKPITKPFPVAGISYRLAHFKAAQFDIHRITLVHEPLNQHDPYAIKVMVGPEHIGYIPRAECAKLHAARDQGIRIKAVLQKLDRGLPPHDACWIFVMAEQDPKLSNLQFVNDTIT